MFAPHLISDVCFTLEFQMFAPHALKGQKPLAQGNTLGNHVIKPVAL
jgi:hypothetical protein